jgi:Immunity protein 51
MKDYIKLSSDKKFGSVSVRLYLTQEKPQELSRKLQSINEQVVMNGQNWEALLHYYLDEHHADISGGMGSDADNKSFVAYYKLNPVNEERAAKLSAILEALIEDESALCETVKNYGDEIDWE